MRVKVGFAGDCLYWCSWIFGAWYVMGTCHGSEFILAERMRAVFSLPCTGSVCQWSSHLLGVTVWPCMHATFSLLFLPTSSSAVRSPAWDHSPAWQPFHCFVPSVSLRDQVTWWRSQSGLATFPCIVLAASSAVRSSTGVTVWPGNISPALHLQRPQQSGHLLGSQSGLATFPLLCACSVLSSQVRGEECRSVGRASDQHAAEAGLSPWCGKGFLSQSQLSMQTLLRSPYSPRVQSHALTSVRM